MRCKDPGCPFYLNNNSPFVSYSKSFDAAAMELAEMPEAQYNRDIQDAVCRKYGIILDDLTDDELYSLSRLVERYAGV